MENKREYGEKLEGFVQQQANIYDVPIHATANSGAKNQNDSDLNHERFQIECKRTSKRTTKGENYPHFNHKDWSKVKKEASMRNKDPALVIGCDNLRDSLVVIKLDTFLSLISGEIDE